jgi:hypothetical protein
MKTFRKRKQKKIHTLKKIKGGALNCDAERFTMEIREATFGRDYPNAIVSHEDSETWDFDKLVDISNRGLVDWYCKKAKLSPDESIRIKEMPEIQYLGAFFHRYKVFSEHIAFTEAKLRRGADSFIEPSSARKLKEKANKVNIQNQIVKALVFIETYVKGGKQYNDFFGSTMIIETVIDRVQCLLWSIVKNKKLPEGFYMDEKIIQRAKEPIILTTDNSYYREKISYKYPIGLIFVENLIQRANLDIQELADVTFNVF